MVRRNARSGWNNDNNNDILDIDVQAAPSDPHLLQLLLGLLADAEAAVALALDAGVNHLDVTIIRTIAS